MPLMLGTVYDALKAANVSDDKAIAAAEEVAAYRTPINLTADMRIVKWMMGLMLILNIATFVRVWGF